jgi:hypothetical protein
LYKPQILVGAVRELPLRYGLPIREWLDDKKEGVGFTYTSFVTQMIGAIA